MNSTRAHTRLRGKREQWFPVLIVCFGILVAGVMVVFNGSRAEAIDIPTSLIISICGDGILNAGELCDAGAGNNTGAYASSTAARICAPGCLSFGPYCGDGVLQVRFTEECDDGNNTSGDLCSAVCISEAPVPPASPPPGSSGSPQVGSTPSIPGGTPGTIPSATETKVVLRGKAYPNAIVSILLDGKAKGTVKADASADFVYSATDITPGTATFGFLATDQNGVESVTTSVVFEIVQSAVTTVANVFLPPTLALSKKQVLPGELLTVSGQSVPTAKVATEINGGEKSSLLSDVDGAGTWALQVDTASLSEGFHTAKAQFELTELIKSGFGRSVSFYIGEGTPGDAISSDLNDDDKINLVDFSIFLTNWNTDDIRTDFNQDGTVNLADFSIMLFNWTG